MATILPEEQPRYTIDEDRAESESEVKILSEEQGNALHKLVKIAGHALTEDERDIITQLHSKLERETQRIQSLKKMAVGDKPLDEYLSEYHKKKGNNNDENSDDESVENPESGSSVKLVVGYAPDDVVKQYIECWNQQKFGTEYDCFSRDLQPYVEARQLFYQQQLRTGGLRIEFGDIISSDSVGGNAEVVATKTVTQGKGNPQNERNLYRLKLERGRWQISSVTTEQ